MIWVLVPVVRIEVLIGGNVWIKSFNGGGQQCSPLQCLAWGLNLSLMGRGRAKVGILIRGGGEQNFSAQFSTTVNSPPQAPTHLLVILDASWINAVGTLTRVVRAHVATLQHLVIVIRLRKLSLRLMEFSTIIVIIFMCSKFLLGHAWEFLWIADFSQTFLRLAVKEGGDGGILIILDTKVLESITLNP